MNHHTPREGHMNRTPRRGDTTSNVRDRRPELVPVPETEAAVRFVAAARWLCHGSEGHCAGLLARRQAMVLVLTGLAWLTYNDDGGPSDPPGPARENRRQPGEWGEAA